MIELLIWLVVVCLVLYVLFWLLRQLSLPDPLRTVIMVVAVLVVLLWFLQRTGLMAGL